MWAGSFAALRIMGNNLWIGVQATTLPFATRPLDPGIAGPETADAATGIANAGFCTLRQSEPR